MPVEDQMNDPQVHLSLTLLVKSIVTGVAAAGVWLLKKLGDRHIASLDALNTKLDKLIEREYNLEKRMAVIETKCDICGREVLDSHGSTF